ncbi:uncharacterized protein LOC111643719 [Copidosoma floridanum]|uniref:uncharacterized protein LOC111643719 n=1 Tax=Copidosoma floridanum TaxID=29053 RepID=UPI000C6F8FD0|nr:uncharacterized protein LOC111643719 [Copidosoma floridanum]
MIYNCIGYEKGQAYATIKIAILPNLLRLINMDRNKKSELLIDHYFKIKLHNGEVVEQQDKFTSQGFCDWKHPNLQYEDQKKYWIKVLKRITDVIKFLACRDLAFRGDNQILGSKHNGNYLGILELLSEYDTFLKEHISCHGNKGHGVTSYLSANICKEFIESMEKNVLKSIIEELKKSKYYSISVDSTPDITPTDQLTFTVRYVIDTGPVERFLTFIPIEGHGAEYLSTVIIDFLEKNDLNIKDCRGQSYDNASNMSGRYSGLQARIKQLNKYAEYIPCAAHSLNLVGVKAAECVQPVVAWRILLVELGAGNLVLKALPATRWSAQADAITALCKGYTNIMKALNKISNDTTMSSEARHEAQSLLKKMLNLQTLFLTIRQTKETVIWRSLAPNQSRSNLQTCETSETILQSDQPKGREC